MSETTVDPAARASWSWRFVAALLLLASLHATLAWQSQRGKTPTFDEPLHGVAALMRWHRGDFVIDPEDPPLWLYWAAMRSPADVIDLDAAPDLYQRAARMSHAQWFFVRHVLLDPETRKPGTTAADVLRPMKQQMLLFGFLLVIATGLFVRDLLRHRSRHHVPLALAAAFLVAVDPNMLAHTPMLKNDVPMALGWVLLAWSLLAVCRRATWRNVALLGLVCGYCATTKFSGVLCGPIVVVVLLLRAFWIREPWIVFGREQPVVGRLVATIEISLLAGAATFVCVWAAYGFRAGSSPDPLTRLQFAWLDDQELVHDYYRIHGDLPRSLDGLRPTATSRLFRVARDAGLLPESYAYGLQYVKVHSAVRSGYVLGERSNVGTWYYFPVAMLTKTPTGTLLIVLAGLAVFVREGRSLSRSPAAIVLAVPVLIYLGSAMNAGINLGLRHVLPVYPLLIAGAACVAARKFATNGRWVRRIGIGSLVLVAVETAARWPDYLAFFNVPSGGPANGDQILLDSNLDWGQDLAGLARWEEAHPDEELWLSYFGTIDPRDYGIRATPSAPDTFFRDPSQPAPTLPPADRDAVLAVSLNQLHGLYNSESERQWLDVLRRAPRRAMIGRSIALFDWPLPFALPSSAPVLPPDDSGTPPDPATRPAP